MEKSRILSENEENTKRKKKVVHLNYLRKFDGRVLYPTAKAVGFTTRFINFHIMYLRFQRRFEPAPHHAQVWRA